MKLEILQEVDNKTLGRKEIKFRIDHQGGTTPSRLDVREKLVAQYDASSSTVIVRHMRTKFGGGVSEGTARIYADESAVQRFELGHILKRHESKKESGEGS